MTRLKKFLHEKGVLFDEPDNPSRLEQECSRELVTIDGDIIVTVVWSAFLPPMLHLFDRHTYEFIGEQYMSKERSLNGKMTWGSYGYVVSD